MAESVQIVVGVLSVLLCSLAWRALNWVWIKPKKLEKYLREQGIDGPSYKFLHGNLQDMAMATMLARSKPMELSHNVAKRVAPFFHHLFQKYGKLSFIWLGPIPTVIIMDPETTREVLFGKPGEVGKAETTALAKLLVTGITSYNGEKWTKHRRIVNPAFHSEKLKMMMPAFYTSCAEMVNKWQKLVGEDSCELDIWPHIQYLTGDVISRAAFGSSYEEGQRIFLLQQEMAELHIQVSRTQYLPGSRFLPTKRNKRMMEIYREVKTLIRDIITKREKAMKSGNMGFKDDLLSLLMESNFKEIKDNGNMKNVGISIDDVIEEVKVFYLAGQETTSTLIVWTFVLLSMHKDWQEKARAEVSQVFGNTKPGYEGLSHLKIITMILQEVLRLYPSVSVLLREIYKKMKFGDIILPPGIQIAMPTILLHHDRELWGEDADEFNPERFSGGVTKATNNQFTYYPFGGGPRICIGQNFAMTEAKLAIAMSLQLFSFELSSTYVHAPTAVLTIQPQHGAQLILHKI